jgi:microcystin-dependent protein
MDAYLGEIRAFCGDYAPNNWMFCEGQLLPISRQSALFSILGTMYGGDGKVTFALPDLRGAVPIGQGQGPGLSQRSVGEMGGSAAVALQANEMPAHNHTANGVTSSGKSKVPVNSMVWSQVDTGGREPSPVNMYATPPNTTMNPGALGISGSGQPHNNMQPFLAVRFNICCNGIFPQRS